MAGRQQQLWARAPGHPGLCQPQPPVWGDGAPDRHAQAWVDRVSAASGQVPVKPEGARILPVSLRGSVSPPHCQKHAECGSSHRPGPSSGTGIVGAGDWQLIRNQRRNLLEELRGCREASTNLFVVKLLCL